MIVKDEAHVIRRCLASVRPIVDHWIVVDTGSSDGTQDMIREAMAGLPGKVVERPWVDFAHNRSEALELARPHGTYSLIIDADDELVLPPDFWLPDLDADSYAIDILYGATTYRRPQLVSNALEWRYRGVLHEFLECAAAKTGGHLSILMKINHEGRRSTEPTTYAKDAATLEQALATETDPFLIARYTFYLAQSYRDCGGKEKAAVTYLKRATLGFWDQEVFVALLQAGRLMEALGRDHEDVLAIYSRATEACPSRAEAAHAASRLCRSLNRYEQGYEVAKPAIALAAPAGGLFVETWVYDYGLLDEYAINAYWAGHYRDCLDACLQALQRGTVPEAERPRFLANMRFALDKLPVSADLPNAIDQRPEHIASSPTRMVRPVPKQLNLGSGKDFRPDFLNIDIDDSWSPDAVLDLSAIKLDEKGIPVSTQRFGDVVLLPGTFDLVIANDVLEHVPDLVALMTTCLGLLRIGGVFKISVPYDLSYGAWQDPTHVRTFNDRSWLYYTDWFWYLGWRDARFVIDAMDHVPSPIGMALRDRNVPSEEIARTPRAIDSMSVALRKIDLTPDDRKTLDHWRERRRVAALADWNGGENRPRPEASVESPPIAFSESWEHARHRFCIWIVTQKDYRHHHTFDEVAEVLGAAFTALGGSAPVVRSESEWGGRTPIVLGGHLLANGAELPRDTILFNFEQIGPNSLWVGDAYLTRLKHHAVLDYSLRNTKALKNAGISHARLLPIRSMPGLGRIEPVSEQDTDVLFYGSINDRRRHVLDGLRDRGLKVVHLFGVYGPERDAAIARAKVVVNIHFDEAAVFEAVRITYLLASGRCVVSEGRPDDPDSADLADGLVLCAYEEIVDHCAILVGDEEKRQMLGARGRAAIEARSQADILRAAFGFGAQQRNASSAAAVR